MMRWRCVDDAGIRWLRHHPCTFVRLPLRCLDHLKKELRLRIAKPLSRTKFGFHVREYREYVERDSFHVREFRRHLEIHVDKWNPDWSVWNFLSHLAEDTPILRIAGTAAVAGMALVTGRPGLLAR